MILRRLKDGRACLGVIWLMSFKAIGVLILIGYLLILEQCFSVLQWCFCGA